MATIPIRDVPGEAVQPSGDELILIDNGIALQKATINDAVTPKATQIVDDKIAELNLGTAAQANTEDFATAAQGQLADSAVQPGDLAAVATSGDYEDLQNKPTLGTAAAANIGEAASDVAAGNRGLPSGGGTGQVLVKNSESDYDAEWREVASATAVSYAPQTLDPSEQAQARENLGATEVGDALFTAASKAAGRSAIDALGPDETPDKAFRQGNILGTVSQSGGTPTGAIIERGSNANGQYVRYADGTQICHYHGTVTNQAINDAYGSSGLFSGERTWTFPAQFASGHIVAFHQGRWGTGVSWSTLSGVTTTTATFRFIDAVSRSTGTDFILNFVAIGRWF